MWKRLPLRDRGAKSSSGRQSLQIGAPTLVESTYDIEQLDRARNLSPIGEHTSTSFPSPGSPFQSTGSPLATSPKPPLSPGEAFYNADIRPSRARQDVSNQAGGMSGAGVEGYRPSQQGGQQQLKIPTMHFHNSGKRNPNDPTSYRPSVAASSVYSQADDEHISPPSSPHRRPHYDDGQISPIEEHSPGGFDDHRPAAKSQIPVPRKVTPRTKEWTQSVGKGAPMMWDDYSGEPTFDGAGKPSQVKPGEFDLRASLKPVKRIPAPVPVTQKTSFKEKATRLARQGLSVDTRPPWKGGSGRHAIVDAPRDKPGQTLPHPRRTEENQKEQHRSKSSGKGSSYNNHASPIVAASPETLQKTSAYAAHDTPEDDFSPRNNVSSVDRGFEHAGPSPYDRADDAYASPVVPDRDVTPTNEYPYSGRAPADLQPAHRGVGVGADYAQPQHEQERQQQQSSYVEDTPPRKSRDTSHSKKTQESPNPNLDSRFSWTTAATSTTYQQSVPPSPPPPMPTHYNLYPSPAGGREFAADSSPASVKASVLDRGHPTRRLGADSPPLPSGRSFSAGSTLRKPVSSAFAVQPPSPEPEVIKQQFPMADWRTHNPPSASTPKQRASSLLSTSTTTTTTHPGKSLPKTPQELSSHDLIASLQAQQSSLALQRRNIEHIITDLEKPESRNPVLHSFRVVREREKQLEGLKGELADVGRREHELGMRLHRAWKRREREDPNAAGSVLWVRRATAGG